MRKRLAVVTVGCKANFADSAAIVRAAVLEGFEVVPHASFADVVVINSCTVTHRADRDSRSLARRSRRENPGATIVLSGCYARVAPDARSRVPEVDYWLGSGNGEDGSGQTLSEILNRVRGGSAEPGTSLSEHAADLLLGHRRTFLKIQDGCDSACAYCVVPLARGKSRSLPEAKILEAAAASEADGARELVLTGIHIGRYGADRGEPDALSSLVRRLLGRLSEARIRLSSIEPKEMNERLLDLLEEHRRVCPHLHVPLQSGCDRTLSRMRRPYRAREYRETVSAAAERIPGIQIGADVMAGFPGETREDFLETVRFLRDAPVHYLHVFPYSSRPGTESAGWKDDVPPAVKKERVGTLLSLDREKRERFAAAQAGRILEVLAERELPGGGRMSGRSENYLEVAFPAGGERLGKLCRVRVGACRNGVLDGEVTG